MELLCSTDDSIAGRAAGRVAAQLAELLHAELAMLDLAVADPAPRLVAAARATGCDLLVVGLTSRSGAVGTVPTGWHHRVVVEAPCPVMLGPARAPLPTRGGVVMAHDVDDLPHQAARVARRLADRLGAPLVITQVVSASKRTPRPSGLQVRRDVRALAGDTLRVTAACSAVDPAEHHQQTRSGSALQAPEATLVVIAGRGTGRTLLPHRRPARRLTSGARLPIVMVPPRAGG